MAKRTIFVNTFTNGILGPDVPMTGPVADGGYIVANTAPGCWGPMLTPAIRGGHEVTTPVIVENAEVGDAIAIKIVSVQITSHGTASGVCLLKDCAPTACGSAGYASRSSWVRSALLWGLR